MNLSRDMPVIKTPKCLTNTTRNCSVININLIDILNGENGDIINRHPLITFSEQFFAYFTPVIFVIGLFGNFVSLGVFLSKNLRNMSASRYLTALSISDISTLIFYVFSEWLKRGLTYISPGTNVSFFDIEGVCQIWLYLNYFSRFMSSWLIVCFTCERFIGVCLPLRRRHLGTLNGTTKIISVLTFVSAILVSYKPFLSEVQTVGSKLTCSSKENFIYVSFILDSIYGLLITFIPVIVITILNLLIVRQLIIRNRRYAHNCKTGDRHIRLEFTFILLAISFFFISVNVPFFVFWFRNFIHSHFIYDDKDYLNSEQMSADYWIAVLSITRTIFYMNYCINFFLYSITGAYFRKQLRSLFYKSDNKYEPCKQSVPTHESHLVRRNSCG